jgi:polyisoprenoid-binding protein YceI
MQASSGQMIEPVVQALLRDRTMAGEWVLEPSKSSIRLKSSSMWGLAPVNGVFREVSGNGTVGADGAASGTVTVRFDLTLLVRSVVAGPGGVRR